MATLSNSLACAALACAAMLAACKQEPAPPDIATATPSAAPVVKAVTIDKGVLAAFAPLPKEFDSDKNPITDAKVTLGRMLFYDARLSKNHDVSCNSCHDLDKYGVDGRPVSLGHKQQPGARNAPTVYNAAGQFVQFWDGRADNVEEQAKGPMLNPVEMAAPGEKFVVRTLESMPGYAKAFKLAFPDDKQPVSFDNFAKAVGAFERKLVTPAPWDRFLAGDDKALTDAQKAGFNTFIATGCQMCHTGVLVGGSMFQKLGLVKPWPNQKDQGRYEVTKKDADRMMFKVPSLRDVAQTGPWFSDASATTLEQAVRMMAEHQLGKTLSDAQATSIVTWLGALTGQIPTDYVKQPELPPSTATTPKADPN